MKRAGGLLILAISLFSSGCTPAASAATPPPVVAASAPAAIAPAAPIVIAPVPVIETPKATVQSEPVPQQAAVPPAPPPAAEPAMLPVPAQAAPALRRLTGDDCCVQPGFSPDGTEIRYIDRPAPSDPVGVYAITTAEGAGPRLVSPRIGFRNGDETIVAEPSGASVRLTDERMGAAWIVNTGGGTPSFAPDNSRLLWTRSDATGNFDQRRTDFWTSALDGSGARVVTSRVAGGFLGWLDPNRILISGRDGGVGQERTVSVIDLATGARRDLLTQKGIRGADIAPGGRWVAFYATFADLPEQNGLSIVDLETGARIKPNVPNVGAFRWAGAGTLLWLPARAEGESSMRLLAIDVASNVVSQLTDPAATPFLVANNDWDVAPDGRSMVFVASENRSIWLLSWG